MKALRNGGGRLSPIAFALALGGWIAPGPAALAGGDGPTPAAAPCPAPTGGKPAGGLHGKRTQSFGTLGYGAPGLHPGFQGFGLGYHQGYGYGGDGLGVGSEGGYPFYGGPGYPHPWPTLRRIGGINPFPYFGGPGYPSPGQPNYFGGVGPLVPDRPVVTLTTDRDAAGYATDYGSFTGALPDPEARFSAATVEAATRSPAGGDVSPVPAPPLIDGTGTLP